MIEDKEKEMQAEANNAILDSDNLKQVKKVYENLGLVEKYIQSGQISLNDPIDMAGGNGVCAKLTEGYNEIKKNNVLVNFNSPADKEIYTAEKPVTKVKRLLSVFDVWKDFLKGKFAGHGFAFWIVISILVDISAFIFFDLAFKKEDE